MRSQLNIKGQMLKQDFARVLRDGGGNIVGIQGPGGEVFDPNPKVLDWADRPQPNEVPPFTPLRFRPSTSLTGVYRTKVPLLMSTNEDQTLWMPMMEQIVYGGSGSVSAPLVTGITTDGINRIPFLTGANAPLLPVGMLYPGLRIVTRMHVKKTGADANASQMFVTLGRNNDITQSDYVFNSSTGAVAGREANVETEARITLLGEHTVAKFTTVKSITDTFPTSAAATDQQSKLNTNQDNYNLIGVSGSAGATHDLIYFSVSIIPF